MDTESNSDKFPGDTGGRVWTQNLIVISFRVTLEVMCGILACRAVMAVHLIIRHLLDQYVSSCHCVGAVVCFTGVRTSE